MTYQDLEAFLQFVAGWQATHPAESKFAYALRRAGNRAKPLIDAYQAEQTDLRIDHASVDTAKNMLRDAQGNFVYTKEEAKACEAAMRKLRQRPITLQPFLVAVDDLPPDLSQAGREVCAGFVLAPLPEDDSVVEAQV